MEYSEFPALGSRRMNQIRGSKIKLKALLKLFDVKLMKFFWLFSNRKSGEHQPAWVAQLSDDSCPLTVDRVQKLLV